MKRENCRSQPRARDSQARQHYPDQKGIRNVKQKVDPMIAGRVEAPQRMFDAKCCIEVGNTAKANPAKTKSAASRRAQLAAHC